METTSTRYYYTFPNQISVYFEETDWGGIISILPDKNAQPLTNPSKSIIGLIQDYKADAKKIRSRYTGKLESFEILDFSNLELTHLPPHILLECKSVKHLDISGNKIRFLPIQLQTLPLETFNISGNKGVQPGIPEWLGNMAELTLTANDIGLDFIPKGFTADRFVSNDYVHDPLWEYKQAQPPIYEDY